MKFLKKHKKAFFITITALCAAAMAITAGFKAAPAAMESAAGFLIAPVQRAFTSSSLWVSEKMNFLGHLGVLESENSRLNAEAEELRIENSRLKQVDAENERLSALLDIDRKYIVYEKTGANVIAKDPGNWYTAFLIDKGTKDGIEKNMVVLGSGGLVGRVLEARYNYAKVISIIEDTSSVSAKSARSEDTGFLRGDIRLGLEGLCRMEFAVEDADVMIGDEIVTSHLSEIYPAGITIGYVTEVSQGGNGLKEAIVKPNMDFRHLDAVLVITELFERDWE